MTKGLPAGAVLQGRHGAYMVTREVARGGMGAILEAQEQGSGRVVAVKAACLDPAFCEGKREVIRERLLQEMSALLPLEHPSLPRVVDQFSSADNEFLVMEFVAGQTLNKILDRAIREKRLLEESRVVGWALQVLDALAYLHGQPKPIIHRDIKPDNLILTPDGRVVLVDFGLMKQVERSLQSGPLIHAVGTVEFAPPEQYAEGSGGTDQRTDIYSLGATLYYLLTSRLPPRSVERMLPFSMGAVKKLPSVRAANATVSPQTERVVARAMEIDPADRYPTAQAMREALAPRRRFFTLPF
ncbi:MAG: serine/threonine protein kinase [Chloroflexi bacterium]|nr:serine/threonine protein kinase [Chloroflexota bacterium]